MLTNNPRWPGKDSTHSSCVYTVFTDMLSKHLPWHELSDCASAGHLVGSLPKHVSELFGKSDEASLVHWAFLVHTVLELTTLFTSPPQVLGLQT